MISGMFQWVTICTDTLHQTLHTAPITFPEGNESNQPLMTPSVAKILHWAKTLVFPRFVVVDDTDPPIHYKVILGALVDRKCSVVN